MKKLLGILGSCVLLTSTASGVVACRTPVPNPINNNDIIITNKINNWYKTQKDKVLIIDIQKNYSQIQLTDVENYLTNIINAITNMTQFKIKINNDNFKKITYQSGTFTNGLCHFTITSQNDQHKIINKFTGDVDFTVTFSNKSVNRVTNILDLLDTSQNNHQDTNSTIDFAIGNTTLGDIKRIFKMLMNIELPIPVDLDSVSLNDIIDSANQMFHIDNIFDLLPTTIPDLNTNGSIGTSPHNSKTWTNFTDKLIQTISALAPTPPQKWTINKSIHLPGVLAYKSVDINCQTNFLSILNGIAPDLIHFYNFYKQYGQHEMPFLLLLQYMLNAKQNYKVVGLDQKEVDDGFVDINTDESGIKTNLDNLIFDLIGNKTTLTRKHYAWYETDINNHYVYHQLENSQYGPVYLNIKLNYYGSSLHTTYDITQSDLNWVCKVDLNEVITNFMSQLLDFDMKQPLTFAVHMKFLGIIPYTYQTAFSTVGLWNATLRNYLSDNGIDVSHYNNDNLNIEDTHIVFQAQQNGAWVKITPQTFSTILNPAACHVRLMLQNTQIHLYDADLQDKFYVKPFSLIINLFS